MSLFFCKDKTLHCFCKDKYPVNTCTEHLNAHRVFVTVRTRVLQTSQSISKHIQPFSMAHPRAAALVVTLLCSMSFLNVVYAQLSRTYYEKTCPNAEKIIRDTVYQLYEKKGNIATSLIRMEFHDSAANGVDGSFLLLSKKGQTSEKDSHAQVGMRNEKYVDTIKAAVEKACPLTVSCADILAVGGAQAVEVLGGPHIDVKLGRKDGRVSLKSEADKIPFPQDSVTKVLAFFTGLGVNTEQAVALLGAHTIGRAHCVSFQERIYPKVDPQMDPTFANMLKYRCPLNAVNPGVHFTYFRNDEQSPMLFDNHYYVNLIKRQGLLGIDSKIYWDPRTKPFVEKFAKDIKHWRDVFTVAFTILTENKPLTGTEGEIRKRCSYVN